MIITNLQEFCPQLAVGKPILGVDLGQKKIGFAISNPEQTIAMPLKVLNAASERDKIREIKELIYLYKPCALVVGLPVNMDGSSGTQVDITMKFTQKVSNQTNLPIFMQDERLTSKAANMLLQTFGMRRRERDKIDDIVAASMILETLLDSIKSFKKQSEQ